ncbi:MULTISPECIES: DUF2304 domain-containing protein [unclassified Cryobacterium]|uniref:DUF2304 domain-containing protein n=1 Tax=unclassified Cryobacterium TaxID=2649013 RepID=UPI002AB52A76|nr:MULTISPECIES: DUF2304 domain-containing protein [unclassified Cryobacterium]MDY7526669.1 DUF2304 domain-containing protein [Cryobacterium sp. 10C2]MDY7557526.1 DUF2304 domain-containing protein [Cryobacterium sp. 10C3]MEB0292373.1 DUF2304 domain-containing protein [Cryobacterium sp. 10C2]
MTVTSYIFGILAALATLAVVVEMLRRRRLRERHAIWWLIAGTAALVIGVFPGALEWAAGLVGVDIPTNLVFFVSIAVLVLVCIQHSAELTDLESKARTLAEMSALQDLRIGRLESSARVRSVRSEGATDVPVRRRP